MEILKNDNIKDRLYYKIGGTVKYVLKCTTEEDIEDALYFIDQNNIQKYLVIGLGSNILMPDDFYDGAVILLGSKNTPQIEILGEDRVKVFAGELFDTLINVTLDNNLIGLEWAGGLPSTVGGAVRGNAGAFGGETKDKVESVEVIEMRDGEIKKTTLTNEECKFGYRHSYIKDNPQLIVVNTTFALKKATPDEVKKSRDVYRDHIEYRNTNHPMQYPSCGSVFKNIRDKKQVEKMLEVWPDAKELVHGKWHGKFSMGYAIKRFGLTGKKIGGAQISKDHSNYIVNVDNAKYNDVTALISLVIDTFQSTFGFSPEPELQIVK
jgi:UDP-N-acetylmuramate dehydrogenase